MNYYNTLIFFFFFSLLSIIYNKTGVQFSCISVGFFAALRIYVKKEKKKPQSIYLQVVSKYDWFRFKKKKKPLLGNRITKSDKRLFLLFLLFRLCCSIIPDDFQLETSRIHPQLLYLYTFIHTSGFVFSFVYIFFIYLYCMYIICCVIFNYFQSL